MVNGTVSAEDVQVRKALDKLYKNGWLVQRGLYDPVRNPHGGNASFDKDGIHFEVLGQPNGNWALSVGD